jgi:hypothetical protein
MAKFLWVGENYDNLGGTSSKAYCLRRSGTSVIVKYGSVEVLGAGGGKIHWVGEYPRIVRKKFGSIQKASSFIRRRELAQESKGYDRLPGRVRIRSNYR